MRIIPPTIATQHPDNALAPYWDEAGRPFISFYQEINEAVICLRDLGTTEYMWDWEGKHADAAVIDRLFSDYYDYFSKQQLGRDKFLTFRIPNIWEEKGYNLLQAMTAILSSEDFARDLKFHDRPLFEVILPMTERADQLLHIQKLFEKLANFKSNQFTPDQPPNNNHLEMIPLVETFGSQIAVGKLLEEYVSLHQEHFKHKPKYLRVFFACSDASLTSGFLARVIINKIAISELDKFSAKTGILTYPFAGAGSLKFRGGLSPDAIDYFLEELPGLRTVTVQSSFRYDHPVEKVMAAIKRLESEMPQTKPQRFKPAVQKSLIEIGRQASDHYRQTLNAVAEDMQPYFKAIPKRRDRRQHIGLVAYSRSMGQHSLPRAITFTAGFYSVGVPPEFIGVGRTLQGLSSADLNTLQTVYPNLANDLLAAGRFLNKANLTTLAKQNSAWQTVQTDIQAAEAVLNIKFEPQSQDEIKHQKLSVQALKTKDTSELTELIAEMAVLRKSLG